jgi:transposase
VADVYQPLTDCQWQVITALGILPHPDRKRRHALRDVVTAIWYVCRTGCQWRALPSPYPPWPAVYYYFRRWQQDLIWQQLNTALNQRDRQREQRAAEPAMICVDSQSVKLLPCIYEARGLDGGKHVNGRKRHIAVDTGGRIWCAHVTAANVADSVGGEELVVAFPRERLAKVLTDAGYRGAFAQAVEAQQLVFEVASRPPTEQGFVPIPFRWVVERTFSWLNWYRRLVHDYDFTTKSHETWLLLANCALCLNRLAPLPAKS